MRAAWWPDLFTDEVDHRSTGIGLLLAPAGWWRGIVVVFLITASGASAVSLMQRIAGRSVEGPTVVDILTQNDGQPAQVIGRDITSPIEAELAGIPEIAAIRAVSLPSASDVKLQFVLGVTEAEARQSVADRLSRLPPLPRDTVPLLTMGQPAVALVRYRLLASPGYSIVDLLTLRTSVLDRRLKALPGVVAAGGANSDGREFTITLDLDRLSGWGLSVAQVMRALGDAKIAAAEETIDFVPHRATLRGVGLFASADKIGGLPLVSAEGVPLRLSDIATVTAAAIPPTVIGARRDREIAYDGIVLLKSDGAERTAVQRIAAEFELINNADILPPGIRIECIGDSEWGLGKAERPLGQTTAAAILGLLLILTAYGGLCPVALSVFAAGFSRRDVAVKPVRRGVRVIDG